jgi:hypothetical protein
MAAYRDLISASLEKQPARTVVAPCDRIFQLTGLRRGPSQVRRFLKDLGLALTQPPPSMRAEHSAQTCCFLAEGHGARTSERPRDLPSRDQQERPNRSLRQHPPRDGGHDSSPSQESR